jgi:hypothetical protein
MTKHGDYEPLGTTVGARPLDPPSAPQLVASLCYSDIRWRAGSNIFSLYNVYINKQSENELFPEVV